MGAHSRRDGSGDLGHAHYVTAKTLRTALEKADHKSTLNADDALANLPIGNDFVAHRTVAHTVGEYVSKDGKARAQTVESFFAILKRGVMGSFHSISERTLTATFRNLPSAGTRAVRSVSRMSSTLD